MGKFARLLGRFYGTTAAARKKGIRGEVSTQGYAQVLGYAPGNPGAI